MRRRTPAILIALCAVFFLAKLAYGFPAFSDFVTVGEGGAYPTVSAALEAGESALYVLHTENARHAVPLENPVVIDREVTVHSSNSSDVVLTAKNRAEPGEPVNPLFEVVQGGNLTLSNVRLNPYWERRINDADRPNAVCVQTHGAGPANVTLLHTHMGACTTEILAPGRLYGQGVVFRPDGWVPTPLYGDHPDADIEILGGNASSFGRAPKFADAYPPEATHIRMRRGCLSVTSQGTQATPGAADYLVEDACPRGAHQIVNVRSEGGRAAPLLWVRAPEKPVDFVLAGNGLAWSKPYKHAELFRYEAGAGTGWILANNGAQGVQRVNLGTTTELRTVAIGNTQQGLLQPLGGLLFRAGQLRYVQGQKPSMVPLGPPKIHQPLPKAPRLEIPEPIEYPPLREPFPDMKNVRDYGATGDGETDDTQAILDAVHDVDGGRNVYFPAGTYRLSDRIIWESPDSPSGNFPGGGGWWAGAGSDRTRLVRDETGEVLSFDGILEMLFSGFTLESPRYDPANPEATRHFNIRMDTAPRGLGFTVTTYNRLHDVRSLGGRYGVGFGPGSLDHGDLNMMVGGEIAYAQYGMVVGGHNALANLLLGVSLHDLDTATGQSAWVAPACGGKLESGVSKVGPDWIEDPALKGKEIAAWHVRFTSGEADGLIAHIGEHDGNRLTFKAPLAIEPKPGDRYLIAERLCVGGTWAVIGGKAERIRVQDFWAASAASSWVGFWHDYETDAPIIHRYGQTGAYFAQLWSQSKIHGSPGFLWEYGPGGTIVLLHTTVDEGKVRFDPVFSLAQLFAIESTPLEVH